jgi:acyl dehydratase
MNYFEDIEAGVPVEIGTHTFAQAEMIRFAEQYDRQDYHLDPEAAKAGPFGGLIASGWYTGAVFQSLFSRHLLKIADELRRAGKPVARLGPSPGFTDLKWPRPVYAGDTVSFRTTVEKKRALNSRPGWGAIHFHNEGFNQKGELVYAFHGITFVERKPA